CYSVPGNRGVGPVLRPHPVYKVGDPYKVDGVWYYPSEDLTYDQTGIASWYGAEFHGKYTANGDVFNANALTAAHKTLPMPSIVQVTNLDNGRTLKLEINDRGPYVRGRIIDVSRRAAQLLGFEGPGTAKVRVKILAAESIQAKLLALSASGQDRLVAEAAPLPLTAVSTTTLNDPAGVRVARDSVRLTVPLAPQSVPEPPRDFEPPPLPQQVVTLPVHPTAIYIQVGAFAEAKNAQRLRARLRKLGRVQVSDTRVNGVNLYRVRLGPVPTVEEADRLLDRIVDSGMTEARIVVN
ncbi:MAG: septal ring lytic transglycosylase RlpA family protein, partial [Stellaceae bacterium]